MGEALITRRGSSTKVVTGKIIPTNDTVTVTLGFRPKRVFIVMDKNLSWSSSYGGVSSAFIDTEENTVANSTHTLQPSGRYYMNTRDDNHPDTSQYTDIITISNNGFKIELVTYSYDNLSYTYIATN